ncbi:MAG: hypothetical protein AB7O96_15020, partial [Pseudobdellovibrionaceae bacterium]
LVTQAHSAQYRLDHVACANPAGPTGPVGVAFTGTFAGEAYFNITLVNFWGVPFPQQAKIVSAQVKDDVLTFDLVTMLTNQKVTLSLYNQTTRGVMSIQRGMAIDLICSSRIDAL